MSAGGVTEALGANGTTAGVGTVGRVRVVLSGTFGGGSAQVETRDPAGAWVVSTAPLTAAGEVIIDAPEHSQNEVRVVLTAATGPTLAVWVQSSLSR